MAIIDSLGVAIIIDSLGVDLIVDTLGGCHCYARVQIVSAQKDVLQSGLHSLDEDMKSQSSAIQNSRAKAATFRNQIKNIYWPSVICQGQVARQNSREDVVCRSTRHWPTESWPTFQCKDVCLTFYKADLTCEYFLDMLCRYVKLQLHALRK